jgi:trans-2,3-dihydro-3-hydroxyanthranilate isomerase
MPAYDYVTVNVFTSERFGGNPLAVFPDASGLTDAQMQRIAADLNLSETVFVLPPADPRHHARVRIFTPKMEMPFAGHPNVGAGFVLARMAGDPPEHYVFEEIAGLVRVHIQRDLKGVITGARISAPRSLSLDIAVPTELVAACSGLSSADIVTEAHTPLVASVGTPFVIAEVRSLEALARARPNTAAFEAGVSRIPALVNRFNLLLYTRRDESLIHLRTRMFAPLAGVVEDPATGSACAALAALLTSLAPGDNVALHYEIEQGVELGRPSQIVAAANKTGEGPVTATVAGNCVPAGHGTLDV